MDHIWLRLTPTMIATELAQATEEGKDLSSVLAEFDVLMNPETFDEARAAALLDRVQELPYTSTQNEDEPSDLESIKALWTSGHKQTPDKAKLSDRILGAWQGRVSGCFLGKVCEGWRRPTMEGYLKGSGQWPLKTFISNKAPHDVLDQFGFKPEHGCWIENISAMPEDDDTNYTVTGLEVVRRYGRDFKPESVAEFWMSNIPLLHTCTAERIAYKNFSICIDPPASASFRNPYREWIGAQIRADFFGYVNPGNPYLAAEYGWRDACISHIKNGIYGEMWSAAMNASALAAASLDEVIEAGFAVIPPKCRLALALEKVIGWHATGKTYDEAVAMIHEEWDENTEHGWCHTISNAMIVLVALLWGDLDFGKTLCYSVQACFDTDCNGATAGSVLGGLIGASKIPAEWTAPFNDTLETGIHGYTKVKISEMAKLTLKLIAKE